MKRIIPFILCLLFTLTALGQGDQASPVIMRSHLKIYVVVAVLLIIFSGIVVYLLSLDRRLKKLENEN